jgi:hypothetical protein
MLCLNLRRKALAQTISRLNNSIPHYHSRVCPAVDSTSRPTPDKERFIAETIKCWQWAAHFNTWQLQFTAAARQYCMPHIIPILETRECEEQIVPWPALPQAASPHLRIQQISWHAVPQSAARPPLPKLPPRPSRAGLRPWHHTSRHPFSPGILSLNCEAQV